MFKRDILKYSDQLKEIAKDLNFLSRPRYPLKFLRHDFPDYAHFINELSDESDIFPINFDDKKRKIDQFTKDVNEASLPVYIKTIFKERAQDYYLLTLMIENYGKVFFYDLCTKLYGSSLYYRNKDAISYFFDEISRFILSSSENRQIYEGESALDYVKSKLEDTLKGSDIEVKASTSLLSDSSAGRKTFKLNLTKTYSQSELDIFVAHEGWAHLGTSLNGALQQEHTWLASWSPQTTSLQEGLAILTEILSGAMTKERWNKIVLRHLATCMAEKGSSSKDVYEFLRHSGVQGLDAFKLSLRIFRGVPLEGGMCFTKELLYIHGLIKLLKHLQFFNPNLRSFWVGKMSFGEHSLLHHHTNLLQQEVKYFPLVLESASSYEKLEKLKLLTQTAFRNDF
jgi:uncharacterized protein (TIGR02421 family)